MRFFFKYLFYWNFYLNWTIPQYRGLLLRAEPCRHRFRAIPSHSALGYSCQVSSTWRGASSNQSLPPSVLPLSRNSTPCIILHFPSNSTSLKNPSSHIVPRRSFSLSHTSPCSHSQWSIFDQWSSMRSKSAEVDCFRLLLRIEGAGVFCQLVPPLLC